MEIVTVFLSLILIISSPDLQSVLFTVHWTRASPWVQEHVFNAREIFHFCLFSPSVPGDLMHPKQPPEHSKTTPLVSQPSFLDNSAINVSLSRHDLQLSTSVTHSPSSPWWSVGRSDPCPSPGRRLICLVHMHRIGSGLRLFSKETEQTPVQL